MSPRQASEHRHFGDQDYPEPWCACGNAQQPGSHTAELCQLFDFDEEEPDPAGPLSPEEDA